MAAKKIAPKPAEQQAYCPDNPDSLVNQEQVTEQTIETPEKKQPEVKKPIASKKKVAVDKLETKKQPVTKPKKKESKRIGVYPVMSKLLIEKKYTDRQIIEAVRKEFPELKSDDALLLKQISACRYFLNAGKRSQYDQKKDGIIEQMVSDGSKAVPYSQRPVSQKPTKKYTPENDPLKKFGFVDEKKSSKATVKDVKKPAGKAKPKAKK